VTNDVVVRAGATCVLDRVSVDGNVKVMNGGTLRVTDSSIKGDIQGDGHRDLAVVGGRVDGNVQVKNGVSATVSGVTIGGDLQAEDNAGAQDFSTNKIDGNLQCTGNTSAPTGTGNSVNGDKEAQCSRL
jgi:cytoskeletal protein CcmA (bactofilin family)